MPRRISSYTVMFISAFTPFGAEAVMTVEPAFIPVIFPEEDIAATPGFSEL